MCCSALESLLDSKEIKPVHPKENQPWIFTGRTDVETKAPVLWPPDAKSWLMGNDSDAGKEVGGEGDDRGRHGWMASLTQWTWVWASSGRSWRTGRPDMLQSMGWQSRTWLTHQFRRLIRISRSETPTRRPDPGRGMCLAGSVVWGPSGRTSPAGPSGTFHPPLGG